MIEFNGTPYTMTREIADIPLLAHTYENGVCSVFGAIESTAQSTDDALPETRDHASVAIGVLLALALCAVAAGAYSLRKVRRH